MIAFPGMLLSPAEKAGMKIPDNVEDFDRNEFPHFFVFCVMQLGASMPSPTSHWHNATVIATVPNDKIMLVTPEQLVAQGLEVGYPLP
jgi:hypothetical protein